MNEKNEKLDFYEKKILATWEEVYKKGQLTFWILLSMRVGDQSMSGIKKFIKESTDDTLVVDDKSMYRALRRLNQMELIDYNDEPNSNGGAAIKLYFLTKAGGSILQEFINRNITGIFFKPEIKKLLNHS